MLNNVNDLGMGIYIHIPFCVKKCLYCDFLSFPYDRNQKNEYKNALIKEINFSSCKNPVSSLFFGGGTPSVLESSDIYEILSHIRKNFEVEEGAEISIECNPGTVSQKKLMEYHSMGFNRISFGLQSTNINELKILGRIHDYETFLESFQMARRAGFDNINVDLIFGLPEQTVASWMDTVEKISSLSPEHISAYSLIIEPGTPLCEMIESEKKKGIDRIPCEENERKMYYELNNILSDKGYRHYEISNFAKPGFESRHNLLYWQSKHYLGFGIGAASYINESRYRNISDINQYINFFSSLKNLDLNEIHEDVQHLTLKNRMEEYMFLGLRLMEGISIDDFNEHFPVRFEEVYGDICKDLIQKGLLINQFNRVYLTKKGIDLSNYAFTEFLL